MVNSIQRVHVGLWSSPNVDVEDIIDGLGTVIVNSGVKYFRNEKTLEIVCWPSDPCEPYN